MKETEESWGHGRCVCPAFTLLACGGHAQESCDWLALTQPRVLLGEEDGSPTVDMNPSQPIFSDSDLRKDSAQLRYQQSVLSSPSPHPLELLVSPAPGGGDTPCHGDMSCRCHAYGQSAQRALQGCHHPLQNTSGLASW